MERGWDATGLLQPMWAQLDGPAKRDRLAELAGIPATNLSAYNSGSRPLGITSARKIVDALNAAGVKVSLLELGAPEGETDRRGQTLLDRLEEVSAKLADSMEAQAKLARRVTALQARVRTLEAHRAPAAADPKRRRGAATQ